MEEKTAANRNEDKETNPEVSLPGSDINSIEQPAILQVLNPLNASEEKIDKIKEDSAKLQKQTAFEKLQTHNNVNYNENSNDKNLVNHSHLVITTPTPTSTPSQIKDFKLDSHTGEIIFPETCNNNNLRQDNVLDIESHLIETYNELLFPNEESVGINELSPIADELRIGCSKIETNDTLRTVIEVEPAQVLAKKPIEQEIKTNVPLQATKIVIPTEASNGERFADKNAIAQIAQQLIGNIEQEIINKWDKISPIETINEEEKPSSKSNKILENGKADANDLATRKLDQTEALAKVNGKFNENLQENLNHVNSNSKEVKTEHFLLPNGTIKVVDESSVEDKLSQVVNQQLSEVNSILDSQKPAHKRESSEALRLPIQKQTNLKVVSVPLSKTASEEEERKLFIESLPPLETSHKTQLCDAEQQFALDCKREYYQSLKKYLVQSSADKPPLPLQTYRWEDLRRAKERGGYPWTHLYKRPLGPDEQPEIVLMLRKSQEIRFTSESPKSNKKVRIDDHVSIQETERYIQELSEDEDVPTTEHLPDHQADDLENHSVHSESFSFASDSILATGKQPKQNKSGRFSKVRRLFRRRRYGARRHDDAQSLPDSFTNTSLEQVSAQGSQNQLEQDKKVQNLANKTKKKEEPIYVHPKTARCFPIMKKLKSLADRQKKRLNIRRIHLGKDDKIVLNEEPKILKLKNSPKSQRSDIPHFIEKQDSDDVLEIVELDESPSRKRKDDDRYDNEEKTESSIVKPEEIIEIKDVQTNAETVTDSAAAAVAVDPPKKAPRLRREHVYEEIEHPDEAVVAAEELKFILDATSVDAIKQSLATQDTSAINEVTTTNNNIPLDRMGSSEEEQITSAEHATTERKSNTLLAPISSIDSASSDEDKTKLHLQPVTEEENEQEPDSQKDYKPSLKKEASPAPSEKKVVTFSHVEDEAEPHREDIELTAEQLEATKEATKWKNAIK